MYLSTLIVDSKGMIDKDFLGELVLDYFSSSNPNLISINNRYGNCADKEGFVVVITFSDSLNLDSLNEDLTNVFCSDKEVLKVFSNQSCDLIQKPFLEARKIPSSFFGPLSEFLKLFISGVFLMWFLGKLGILKPLKK